MRYIFVKFANYMHKYLKKSLTGGKFCIIISLSNEGRVSKMKKAIALILSLVLMMSCCSALAEDAKPLAGKKLTIALSPNFMFFETVSETDPTGYEGLDIDIIKELSDMLGFEFEIVPMSFSSLVGPAGQ